MYERFILPGEVERNGTRQLVQTNFAIARLWDVHDECDFIMDMELALDKTVFFRWAASTVGPAGLVLYSCYNMSLELHEPPLWMVHEIRCLAYRLTDGVK
jgi:hypothetical protein